MSLAVLIAAHASASDVIALEVSLSALRNDEGLIRVAVHASGSTFPSATPLTAASISPIEGEATIQFELPPGRYAVSVLHDEDSDGELDTGLFGIPKEGFGASTRVRRLGPPRWEDCAFELTEDATLPIRMTYLL